MKVIKYGHIEPVRARCCGCGALLEFSEREARDFNDGLYIICPMCGRGIGEDEWEQQDAEEVKLFNSNDVEYIF